jgi:pimeloyl-ACP methyl ester carboxylesterase
MKKCIFLLALIVFLTGLSACKITLTQETPTTTPLPPFTASPTQAAESTATVEAPDVSVTPVVEGFVPFFEETGCKFDVPAWLNWECGLVTVLENRDLPEGNQVKIPVVRFRSRNSVSEPDPVFYLTGGGGGNELDNIQKYSSVIMRVTQDRDYIMYNQRGAKYSIPYLVCPGHADFNQEIVEDQLPDVYANNSQVDFSSECSSDLRAEGWDLNMYNSAVNAADLNDIRQAMGYEQINIYGTSYGTRLALAVLRDYPEIIRSAILDSVYPPQVDFFSEYALNAFNAFTRVFDACAADESCRAAYPNPEEQLAQVVNSLNAAPRSMTHGVHTLYYDGDDFLDTIYLYPYAHHADMLPYLIYQASQGDFQYVEEIMPFTLEVEPSDTIAEGTQNSILCREEIPYETYQGLVEIGESIPPHYSQTYQSNLPWRICEVWGVDPADPYVNQPVYSDVPTLILEGIFDPITPIEWGQMASETLDTSYYYEFPGGHGIMRTYDCGRDIGLQFLDDPWTAPDDSCIQYMYPVEFLLP